MHYVTGGARELGCLFCNRLEAEDDVASLILHRGERAFVIMNLFPYNTGHVMIVPNEHAASPETADPASLATVAAIEGPLLRALRRSLSCDGFNLGLNVGAVAGAGVAEHMHEHVVPRWAGDANFMPILAATKVLPELIPVTYAKTRAELGRELGVGAGVAVVMLDEDGRHVLVEPDGNLPRALAKEDEPLWQAAMRTAAERGVANPRILGWAGANLAGPGPAVLALAGELPPETGLATGAGAIAVSEATPDDVRPAVLAALRCLRQHAPAEWPAP
jgi:ATP adenylyltransferase